MNDHRPRFVCLLCMPSFCCLRWRCFARCVSGLRPDSEREATPAHHCAAYSMASVKEKPPLLGKIVEKSVVLGEQGRLIFHADRRNPEQGRYFFHSTPIAMRHGGNARRVSVSVSFPWPKQVVAMKMKRSVSETAAGGATQVAQLRLLQPTARKKSPCCECLRRKRDNFRPACRKWREMGDFCGVWRVLYRLGWTGVCAGRVLSRFEHAGVCAGRVLYRRAPISLHAGRVLSRIAPERGHWGSAARPRSSASSQPGTAVSGPVAAPRTANLAQASSLTPGR